MSRNIRKHMILSTVKNLLIHDIISTTSTLGKLTCQYTEKLITKVKRYLSQNLDKIENAYILRYLSKKLPINNGDKDKKMFIAKTISLAKRFESRPGGYISKKKLPVRNGSKRILLKFV